MLGIYRNRQFCILKFYQARRNDIFFKTRTTEGCARQMPVLTITANPIY